MEQIGNNDYTSKVETKKDDSEKLRLKEEIKGETKEKLNTEKLIQETKISLYENLGIDLKLENNGDIKKFVKGIIDGLIVNNVETIHQLVNSQIEELEKILKELLSVSGIIELLKSLKEEIKDLGNVLQKPYEGGVAIGGYGLGFIGKGFKGLNLFRNIEKVEHKTHVPHNGIDLNKVDFLEMKGTFSLSKIPNLPVGKAKELIESFANKIDVKYLINNPKRISDILDIVDSMCDYINNNASNILKLQSKDLNDFRYVFGELRKNLGNLGKDDLLGRRKIDILELKDGKMKDTITILNPNLLPKK